MTPDRWQQIERLYHSVLEREESQRAAYLKAACAGDESLVKEVESLLAQDKGARGFLEAPAIEVAAKILHDDRDRSLLGRQMGSYQILSLLGAGGMGEVYLAHDSKLRRDVAIKVLPAAFVHDSERLSRFQREARMLASLNHPNIATIYGLEQWDGVHYLVMELVPGKTLAERVKRGGPVPIEEALTIAKQIAEALEAAHEKGIIHRDLKPANVKVTSEGKVKVLDFGLAKAFTGDAANDDPSNSPTLSMAATMQGMILGTAAYMSPEQAKGKAVDKRTDIWAFGCVLYELLTAKRAFRGETIQDTIAAVLEREPDWQALPASAPPGVCYLVRRCLKKDPQRRLRDVGDARIDIEEAFEALSAPLSSESIASRVQQPRIWQWALLSSLVSLLIGIVTGIAVWSLKQKPVEDLRPTTRMVIAPPGEQLLGADTSSPIVALSPDGTRLVSVVRRRGTTQLYLRRLDQLEFTAIPGTEGAINPFFSPDSQWIGFFSVPDVKLKKISVTSGTSQILCNTSIISGASWGPNGQIIFSPSSGNSGLYEVSDAGGQAKLLTSPDFNKGETAYSWPEFLPDGKSVLFSVQHRGEAADDSQIVVQSIETGVRRVLTVGGMLPRYVPVGLIVYVRGGTLMAVPFDPERKEVMGAAVAVQEGVRSGVTAHFSFSKFGQFVYVPSGESKLRRLVWVDRKGLAQPLAAEPHNYQFPRLSPEGRKIAVQIQAVKSDIWVYDLIRGTLSRLTSDGDNSWPIWTPDGQRVTFTSNKGGHPNIFWKLADGSGTEERLTTSEHGQNPRSWSPDGQELVFEDTDNTTGEDIWVLPLEGDRNPRPFLRTPFSEGWAMLSADGRYLAYVSKELARSEVYVQPFPNAGGRWQISTEGGTEPVWARSGRELFYRSGDKMMGVDITEQPNFAAGKPRLLFQSAEYERVSTTPNYDVSPDGQRFLMVEASEQQSAPQINVVLNWFEELKRLAPTKQ